MIIVAFIAIAIVGLETIALSQGIDGLGLSAACGSLGMIAGGIITHTYKERIKLMQNRTGKSIPPEQLAALSEDQRTALEKFNSNLSKVESAPEGLSFDMSLFVSQLEEALDNLFDDLSRLKGFNLPSLIRAITFLLSAAPVVVPLWELATPQQRKEAVVAAINRKVDIPVIPESVEAWVFGYVYDIVSKKLGF